MVGVGNNQLTSIDGACLPEGLEWLIAAGNQVKELTNVSRLSRVRKLMLSHNRLTCDALAPVAGMAGLEMIRVAGNCLEAFPEELLRHRHLSWIAVGGNPFTDASMERRLDSGPPSIDFAEISLGPRLGSGAGATVYAAQWRGLEVAVKLWEGERFSDGTARGEWAANRVAGHPGHECLVGVLGTFEEPPGMVLERLQGKAAAGPPTFEPWTVTRDGPPRRLAASAALAIASAVARACAYLHSRGLLHGDVYLHNTLVDIEGPPECAVVRDARLSDFGAAAAVDNPLFFKVEARSFGWMLQDLLEALVPLPGEEELVALLQDTREKCSREDIDQLPSFSELAAALCATPPRPSM
eukprot:CAMPEP_0170573190 /NCGR_PEP_ID=MMETSP0224-20130122/2632_1 /TAXON_ID=285029 /ORGANISM="Togula jolla, Strain CCCM 725" /LENGTH=353 /DNA_ID=CAMNT_0010895759 /DNA_START=85 /DNA_END=1146 /DNA_ORIENTATION=-